MSPYGSIISPYMGQSGRMKQLKSMPFLSYFLSQSKLLTGRMPINESSIRQTKIITLASRRISTANVRFCPPLPTGLQNTEKKYIIYTPRMHVFYEPFS